MTVIELKCIGFLKGVIAMAFRYRIFRITYYGTNKIHFELSVCGF